MQKAIILSFVALTIIAFSTTRARPQELPELTPTVVRAGEKFKDRIWLWCHIEGAHDNSRYQNYGFGKYHFTTSPREAADLLRIENAFMVRYNRGRHPGPKPSDFASYYESRNFDRF